MHAERRAGPELESVSTRMTAATGIRNASEDLHDPHPATRDAHARDIRGCREILGAHSTRLRAVGRCGKPPDSVPETRVPTRRARLQTVQGPSGARSARVRIGGAWASRASLGRADGPSSLRRRSPRAPSPRRRARAHRARRARARRGARAAGSASPAGRRACASEPALRAEAQGSAVAPGFAPAPSRTSPITSARCSGSQNATSDARGVERHGCHRAAHRLR